jgi:hypothetical protein
VTVCQSDSRSLSHFSVGFCCELTPHTPEDCMDYVSGRSIPEDSMSEMAVVGRRRPCTVLRSGINRLVDIKITQSIPVDR